MAVQGVGNVSFELCRYLHKEGAQLIVSDIYEPSVKRAVDAFGAEVVNVNDIYDVECDIFAPCALGAVINDDTINRLRSKVIAGAANNQLKEQRHGDLLHEKGFVYAPDYVINAGGVINVYDELLGYDRDRVMKKVEGLFDSMTKVFDVSKRDKIPSYKAADRMAEERIASIGAVQKSYLK